MQSQLAQSIGQFLIVFFTGMAIYKGWTEVQTMGVLNAVYQPFIQGAISALGIYGISKIPQGRTP